jgi:general secretion pathway protein D
MSDTVSESEDRVPGLGAIPIIGNLFKSRSGSRQKKNLIVFIRPKILRDEDQTESTSVDKYNEVRGEQQVLHKGGHITLLPGQTQPVIPEIPAGRVRSTPGVPTNAQGASENPAPTPAPDPPTTQATPLP